MKHILLISAALLLFSKALNAQTVGRLDANGSPVLTADPQTIMTNLQNNLAAFSDIHVTFNAVSISSYNGDYFIVFTDGSTRTSLPLEVESGGDLVAQKISCTTKACASNNGCTPNWLGRSCSDCPGGDCVKTTSNFWLLQQ